MKPARPRFVVTLTPAGPEVDGIKALRALLKSALRRFGLSCVDAYEDKSSPLPISNATSDEFRELRDEVITARATETDWPDDDFGTGKEEQLDHAH
jgi:hypothetical protein